MMDINVTTAKQILSNPPEGLSDMLSNIPNGTKSALLSAGYSVNPSSTSNGQNNISDSPVCTILNGFFFPLVKSSGGANNSTPVRQFQSR